MKHYQYRAIHTAVAAVWGKPKKCEICGDTRGGKRHEWSNKNHRYFLLRKDWQELCSKCHREYDAKKFGKMAWNKGKFGRQPWHNIKGLNNGKPWNKGIKNKENVICICGKSFYPPKKTSTFCSKHCAMKNNKRSVKENNLI